jgi:hypothetical protein
VFHQQAVDEDVSATDAAQEDQVNAVVEEVVAGEDEDEAESVVLDEKYFFITNPENQYKKQPATQFENQSAT